MQTNVLRELEPTRSSDQYNSYRSVCRPFAFLVSPDTNDSYCSIVANQGKPSEAAFMKISMLSWRIGAQK